MKKNDHLYMQGCSRSPRYTGKLKKKEQNVEIISVGKNYFPHMFINAESTPGGSMRNWYHGYLWERDLGGSEPVAGKTYFSLW